MSAHHHHTSAGDELAAGVVLDIGEDVGAVVVYLDDTPVGDELEMQPVGRPSGRFHTGVHPRRIGDTVARAAVFPAVVAGSYELLDDQAMPFHRLDAVGGHVQTLDLRKDHP